MQAELQHAQGTSKASGVAGVVFAVGRAALCVSMRHFRVAFATGDSGGGAAASPRRGAVFPLAFVAESRVEMS